ncbi:MAG: hypothetical protein Q9163_003415 [Psora crenata]
MLPDEIEHTREPAYDKEFDWPPLCNYRPTSNLTSHTETTETGDGSSSRDGSNIAGSLCSKDTAASSDDGIPLELPVVCLLHERFRSKETTSDAAQTSLPNMPPLVDSKHTKSLTASDEILASRDVMDGGKSSNSSEGMRLLETGVHDAVESIKSSETVVELQDSDGIADNDVLNPAAAVADVIPEDIKFSAKAHSHQLALASVHNAESGQGSADIESLSKAPSVAISCPTTISATDAPSTRLRHMIANSPSIILCPGVYDGLSARIALHVGFQGMYMTGAGTTASCLGASDLGIAHLHDMRTNADMIANLQPDGPPLIADMDTGYGGPLIISRAVKAYARAGVAAFHIEDQVPEKRCGHLSGKEVVDLETYLRRIRACLAARAQIRSDIIVIARTDALQSRGYAECVERLRCARDLGADMGILEGVASKETAAQAVKDLAPWPLCYNSVENGHSPLITAAEAQAMGYRLMIFSFAGIGSAYMAILETFTKLKEHGVTGSTVGPRKIFEVCGLEEEMRIDEAAGGTAFAKGV